MRTVKITEQADYQLDILKVLSLKRYKMRFTKGELIAMSLKILMSKITEGKKDGTE
jgi:hypothetical protein